MVSNIVLISPLEDYKKKIGLVLSRKLNMFYVDVDELVTYDVIDPEEVVEKMGVEYFNKLVNKQIKNVSEFENTIITLDTNKFLENNNADILKKNCFVIFVKPEEKQFLTYLKSFKNDSLQKINMVLFESICKSCAKLSNLTHKINNKNTNEICKNLIIEISKHFQ